MKRNCYKHPWLAHLLVIPLLCVFGNGLHATEDTSSAFSSSSDLDLEESLTFDDDNLDDLDLDLDIQSLDLADLLAPEEIDSAVDVKTQIKGKAIADVGQQKCVELLTEENRLNAVAEAITGSAIAEHVTTEVIADAEQQETEQQSIIEEQRLSAVASAIAGSAIAEHVTTEVIADAEQRETEQQPIMEEQRLSAVAGAIEGSAIAEHVTTEVIADAEQQETEQQPIIEEQRLSAVAGAIAGSAIAEHVTTEVIADAEQRETEQQPIIEEQRLSAVAGAIEGSAIAEHVTTEVIADAEQQETEQQPIIEEQRLSAVAGAIAGSAIAEHVTTEVIADAEQQETEQQPIIEEQRLSAVAGAIAGSAIAEHVTIEAIADAAPAPSEMSEESIQLAGLAEGDTGEPIYPEVLVEIEPLETSPVTEPLRLLTGLAQGSHGGSADSTTDEEILATEIAEAPVPKSIITHLEPYASALVEEIPVQEQPTLPVPSVETKFSEPATRPITVIPHRDTPLECQTGVKNTLSTGTSHVPLFLLQGATVGALSGDKCVMIATSPTMSAKGQPFYLDIASIVAESARASQQLPRPVMNYIPDPLAAAHAETGCSVPSQIAASQYRPCQLSLAAVSTATLAGAGSYMQTKGLVDGLSIMCDEGLIADAQLVVPPAAEKKPAEDTGTQVAPDSLVNPIGRPVLVPVPVTPTEQVLVPMQVPPSTVPPGTIPEQVVVPVQVPAATPTVAPVVPVEVPVTTPTAAPIVPVEVPAATPTAAPVVPVPVPSSQETAVPTETAPPPPPVETTETSASSSSTVVAPVAPSPNAQGTETTEGSQKPGFLIKFNNISIIEYIRYISKITSRNFIFNESDLDFAVTIVSEEPATIDDIMTALLQELRIHGLSLMEQGNNIIIHRNPDIKSPAKVVLEGTDQTAEQSKGSDLITSVFRLNTVPASQMSAIVAPLLSTQAIVEATEDSGHLIVTDFKTNIDKIAELIKNLDAPMGGLLIGQYVVRNTSIDGLVNVVKKILAPIAQGKTLEFVPHPPSSSIYVISSPYLVQHTIAMLQHVDFNGGATGLLTLEQLAQVNRQQEEEELAGLPPGVTREEAAEIRRRKLAAEGSSVEGILPGTVIPGAVVPGAVVPGAVVPVLSLPSLVGSYPNWSPELPPGHIENTQFYIHKLQYRKGDQISAALRRISESLQLNPGSNLDLITTINSIQWLEAPNSLVMTGTPVALEKIRELIAEVDLPLRQVFVEMLILDTNIDDSLTYSVDVGSRFGGPTSAGSQAFLNSPSALPGALNTAILPVSMGGPGPNILDPSLILPASTVGGANGFGIGVIGRTIFHGNNSFASLGALIQSLHLDNTVDILLNPKILVEDNTAAEIFVGINTPFQTQTVVNSFGTILTSNFEYRDVGTRFKVTPLLGNSDIITLIIEEEVSTLDPLAGIVASAGVAASPGPTTRKSNATTRVHIPNEYFLIMSGIIADEEDRRVNQMPCLGSIPILGAAVKNYQFTNRKRNLMIFLRPRIIDTEEEMDDITKRQQDIYIQRARHRNRWTEEIDAGLDFLNLTCEER